MTLAAISEPADQIESPRVAGLRLLRREPYGALIGANALTAVASYMQQLMLGWLAVSWGHSWLYLILFAAARVIPKVALTVPAGIFCDRYPRTKVLFCCRALNSLATLLPLAGFFLPLPMVWLMTGVAIGGAIHAFDMPAGRAVLGDVTPKADLNPVIALNNGGSHIAALVGPPLAFLLGPWGLWLSASLFVIASMLTLRIPPCDPRSTAVTKGPAIRELMAYLTTSPTVCLLVLMSIAPGLVDRMVTLLLPSIGHGDGAVSLALLAPELGALVAACLLSMHQMRFSVVAVVACAVLYAALLTIALGFSSTPELLILGLGLAGVAKLTFNTTSQVRIQEAVPHDLRGRVLAI